MPTVPRYSKCNALGCKGARSKYNSYCLAHGGKDKLDLSPEQYSKRKDFNEKYQTRQWRQLRKVQLSQHPLCAGCLSKGIIVQALHIDHVFPWSKINPQAFYFNLFQSLCHSCHSSKTALEQKGIYRRYGIPNRDYRLEEYGMVVQSCHSAQKS